jgi:acyl-CoA reductase-like NAD-dependent aldehyde dehydrogenase
MTHPIELYWRNFVAGRWVDGSGRIVVENPATAKPLAEIARARAGEVDAAVAAARRCFASRALVDVRPRERAAMLVRIAAELRALAAEGGRVACLENGKPLSEARYEFEEAALYFEYYGGIADKIEGRSIPLGADYVDYTVATPYGVSAHIVPWNFPVSLAARSLSCSLAAGNCTVIKSPELSPLALTLIGVACERAGVPEGAVNIICGFGHDAGAALVRHPGVDHIVFTGSVPTGQSILHAAAERVVPCVMELGGKSAAIVYPDADLERVVASTKLGIFYNSGQVCSAMSRALVHASVHDELVDRLKVMTNALSIGPGFDNADVTPLISATQLERVEALCRAGLDAGVVPVTGGSRVADSPGHFMQPTLFTGVTPHMAIAREEIFGPALSLLTFDSPEEAVAIANGTDFGLVAGVFTRDLDRALWTAEHLVAGQVFVNEWFAGGVETPFGGTKRSGYGREKGQEALLNYVQTKNIAIRLGRR